MMKVQGILPVLLQVVLMAVIPLITSYIIKHVNTQADVALTKQDNELTARYIDEIRLAVNNAVLFTSQTYTDELRKNNEFTKDNQKQALGLALDMTKGALTQDALHFIQMVYGDLQAYLTLQIEAEVRALKN